MINLKNTLLVILGSAAGGGLRYIISTVVQQKTIGKFPMGTFTVNMFGCFIMGIIFGLADKNSATQLSLILLLATGFCGGFTTFSAFAYENINLLKSQLNVLALAYILLSVIMGILAVRWGMSIIK
jgi:CrcB protein